MASSYALPTNGINGFAGGNGYALHGHGHQRSRTGYLAPPNAVPSSPANGTTVKKNKSLGDLDVFTRGVLDPTGSTPSPLNTNASSQIGVNGNNTQVNEMQSGRSRGISDLGQPLSATDLASAQPTWTRFFSLPEPITALLVPLPFILGSASSLASVDSEGKTISLSVYARLSQVLGYQDSLCHGSSLPSGLLTAAGLATAILLCSGAVARGNAPESLLDRRKSRHKRESSMGDVIAQVSRVASVADILSRILSVFLPVLAAVKLGGMQVGLMLLSTVIAAGIDTRVPRTDTVKDRASALFKNKFTLGALALQLLYDAWTAKSANTSSLFLGYAALGLSLTAFQIPLPSSRRALSIAGTGSSSTHVACMTWVAPTMTSTLTSSTYDAEMTLAAAFTLFVLTILGSLLSSSSFSLSTNFNICTVLCVASGIGLVFLADSASIRNRGRISFAILGLAVLAILASRARSASELLAATLPSLLVAGVELDYVFHHGKLREHHHGHDHHSHTEHSAFTEFLLKHCGEGGVLHGILSEKDSRRILYFTILNFLFMLVQAFYGYATGSLGLLSDTVHMFFDCLALILGLFAAVASKWAATPDKPYGWGKLNTLSGFANSIFLCLVSIEFVFGAISEYAAGEELRRVDELLTVSVLGFVVNMVGLFAFGHAHHGHDHGHDHSHEIAQSHSSVPPTPFPPTPFSAEHSEPSPSVPKALAQHSHHHSHSNENMIGIWLHVLADALGSVAVIVSTLLTKFYPWSGWDPLAALIIAVLIFASAVPLAISSGKNLLLSLPGDVEYAIRNTLQELSALRGVVGYNVPRFWIEDAESSHAHSHEHHHDHHHHHDHVHDHVHDHKHDHEHDHKHTGCQFPEHDHDHNHDHESEPDHVASGQQKILGVIHIVAAKHVDLEDVRDRVGQFLKSRRMDVVVHVERDGEGRCWCGAGEKKA